MFKSTFYILQEELEIKQDSTKEYLGKLQYKVQNDENVYNVHKAQSAVMRKARQNIDLTLMTVFYYENNQSEQYKDYTGHQEYDIKSLATPKKMLTFCCLVTQKCNCICKSNY